MNTRSKKESKPTKERIFDVSLELFSQRGFDAVSVREIAREVGIRESSIYNHYKNKEAILDTIIEYFIGQLAQSGLPDDLGDELISQNPEVFFMIPPKITVRPLL